LQKDSAEITVTGNKFDVQKMLKHMKHEMPSTISADVSAVSKIYPSLSSDAIENLSEINNSESPKKSISAGENVAVHSETKKETRKRCSSVNDIVCRASKSKKRSPSDASENSANECTTAEASDVTTGKTSTCESRESKSHQKPSASNEAISSTSSLKIQETPGLAMEMPLGVTNVPESQKKSSLAKKGKYHSSTTKISSCPKVIMSHACI